VSTIVLDDHLLGDVIGDTIPPHLARLMKRREVATTNLYYVRLCKAAVSARGGAITRHWDAIRREQAARSLLELPDAIQILPMRDLAFRIATLARDFRLSTLGAEAVAAAEALRAQVCVWEGDAGPRIRDACAELRLRHHEIQRH